MKNSHQLSSIPDLFKQSWQLFKQSALNLFLLTLMNFGSVLFVALILAIIGFLLGFGTFLTNPETTFPELITTPLLIFGLVALILIAVIMLRIAKHQFPF